MWLRRELQHLRSLPAEPHGETMGTPACLTSICCIATPVLRGVDSRALSFLRGRRYGLRESTETIVIQETGVERTLSIIKPDGVGRNLIGEIYKRFEAAGLKIVAARMMQLTQEQAEEFYAVHKERPFYKDLVHYMTRGPVMVQVLEGEAAISRNREIMGATDPKEAAPGTIRAEFAESIDANVVHGSDAPQTAQQEIAFFFGDNEICSRAA